jgi:hypothetical protein
MRRAASQRSALATARKPLRCPHRPLRCPAAPQHQPSAHNATSGQDSRASVAAKGWGQTAMPGGGVAAGRFAYPGHPSPVPILKILRGGVGVWREGGMTAGDEALHRKCAALREEHTTPPLKGGRVFCAPPQEGKVCEVCAFGEKCAVWCALFCALCRIGVLHPGSVSGYKTIGLFAFLLSH